ncbi:hypothetical protein Q1695_001576 [Nippostrongylus brasiliensis]|nr:hypothetical protein Q1695_001576 [Nippostrongylus brasiliensis]
MKNRKLFILLSLSLVFSSIFTQSIDEEEPHPLVEGSGGDSVSDDEDIEGSLLPPDSNYASTTIVHPRLTHTTTPSEKLKTAVKYTTVMKIQRISTFATSTPGITVRPVPGDSAVSRTSFSTSTTFIILGLLVLLIVIIIAVVCVACCRNRRKAYRPGEHRRSDALLDSPNSR